MSELQIPRGGLERVPALQPLWAAMHAHHASMEADVAPRSLGETPIFVPIEYHVIPSGYGSLSRGFPSLGTAAPRERH